MDHYLDAPDPKDRLLGTPLAGLELEMNGTELATYLESSFAALDRDQILDQLEQAMATLWRLEAPREQFQRDNPASDFESPEGGYE